MRVKILLVILAITIGLILLIETLLRLILGFGNPPIYLADESIGYLLAPNQKVRRFNKRMVINQYSQRNETISPQKSSQTLRLFLLGDSVANGAWWTDQNEIISNLIKQQLELKKSQPVEVLNASANSWSPRNQLAYLERYGTFEAEVIILLINTDDLFGTAPTSLPVGNSVSYPDSKPPLAFIELYQRYFVEEKPIPGMAEVKAESGDRVGFNLAAITNIKKISQQNNSKFILAMTPLWREVESHPRDYEKKARQRLLEFTQAEEIPYTDFLPLFKQTNSPKSLFRDHIHLSPEGNQLVSDILTQEILSILEKS